MKGASEAAIASLLTKGSFVCLYIMDAFAQGLEASEALTRLRGSSGRIMEVIEHLDGTYKHSTKGHSHLLTSIVSSTSTTSLPGFSPSFPTCNKVISCRAGDQNEVLLTLCGVSIAKPGLENTDEQVILVKDLSLTVRRGEHLLISGPSGCGKTSLLRVIAGLQRALAGHIEHIGSSTQVPHGQAPLQLQIKVQYERRATVHSSSVIFIPQQAYCFEGTLADNLVYPHVWDGVYPDVSTLVTHINALELSHLLGGSKDESFKGMTAINDWPNILSHGEKQRVCLARTLCHKPALLISDESTSNLDKRIEAKIFQLIKDQGTTIVTVGHSTSLFEHHKKVLTIIGDGSGGWLLRDI